MSQHLHFPDRNEALFGVVAGISALLAGFTVLASPGGDVMGIDVHANECSAPSRTTLVSELRQPMFFDADADARTASLCEPGRQDMRVTMR